MDGESGGIWLQERVGGDIRKPSLAGHSAAALGAEYRMRLTRDKISTAEGRRQTRSTLLRDAGATTYDTIEREFHRVARKLEWPATATIKGFRHLFATALEDAGCPENYRRYFMGQAPGRAAIVRYTHLHQLHRHFEQLLESEFQPIVKCLMKAVDTLPPDRTHSPS